MTYELILQEEASLEILEAYIYYEDAQKGLGEKFMIHLDKYLRRIQNNPQHFQLKKNYRETYIHKFPYLIVFDIIDYKIIVLSVFNTHQNPTKKP
jgi:hypothetical protein